MNFLKKSSQSTFLKSSQSTFKKSSQSTFKKSAQNIILKVYFLSRLVLDPVL